MKFVNQRNRDYRNYNTDRLDAQYIITDITTQMPYYEPNDEELKGIKKFLRWEKIGSGAIAIFWNFFPGIMISLLINNEFDSTLLLFIAIFGSVGIWLIYRFIKAVLANDRNCLYSRGIVQDSWVERSRDSDGDVNYHYYVMVQLDNGLTVPEISCKRKYHLVRGQQVVIIHKKGKIIGVVPAYTFRY